VVVFFLRVAAAMVFGALVGVERQLRQRSAGLRTNALVSMGAAMFAALTGLTAGADPTRMGAAVVTGIGFLGAGVILREGFSIKGLNTAATLWCSAALGVLAGQGFVLEALLGTGLVLVANLALRPAAAFLNKRSKSSKVDQDHEDAT
jgi:putative Mg2+ transporter-C (MgtC) family protein